MSAHQAFVRSILVSVWISMPLAAQAGELFEVLEPLAARSSTEAALTHLHRIVVDRAALDAAELVLPVPGREPVRARLDQVERRRSPQGQGESLTWRGWSETRGRVVLTWVRGYLVGLIYIGEDVYEILTLAEGGQAIAKLDPGRFPACLGAVEPPPADAAMPAVPGRSASGERITEDPASDIDLLSFYTAQSRDAAGGVAQIEATLQAAVDMANTAFLDSDMVARFDLVATALSTRTDSGNMSADLAWLRGDAATTALRNVVGADLVSLVVNSGGGSCGVGYVMRNPSLTFESSGFQVTALSCAVGNLTFAHEHGHNMGFEHDPANGTTPANASFPWSFGHFVSGSYRTVMSYSTECSGGCTRVAHFSNPDILHNGVPTGIAEERDNARSGDSTAPFVANFRDAGAISLIFTDGFESGLTTAWSLVSP